MQQRRNYKCCFNKVNVAIHTQVKLNMASEEKMMQLWMGVQDAPTHIFLEIATH